MLDEEKNTPENSEKGEQEESTQSEKAEEAAEEAKEAAEEAQEAVEEVKEAVEETKAEEAKPQEPKEEPKPEAKKEIVVSGKLGTIIKEIENLSVLELADLVKALEDKFGVSAAPTFGVGVAAAPVAGGGEAAAEEGQTTFNVVLAESGANKISVIKAVRELVPTLGLKEAKDLVDSAPKPVLEGIGKDAANEAKLKLEAAGAKVELQ